MPHGIDDEAVAFYGMVAVGDLDPDSLAVVMAGVIAHVEHTFDPWKLSTDPVATAAADPNWSDECPDLYLGTIMMIWRYRRRPEAPGGVVTFDGFSGVVAAYDPDITRLVSPFEIIRFA